MAADPTFTSEERALVRAEFTQRFGTLPRVADGLLVTRWAGGPTKGQPKINRVLQGLIDRHLVELHDEGALWLRAVFTPLGYQALRAMAGNPRFLPPDKFGHVLQELDPPG